MAVKNMKQKCSVCGRNFNARELVHGTLVRDSIAELIRQDHPDWSANSMICHKDLGRYRAAYVHTLLASEKGELTVLENEVLESLQKHELLSSDIESEFEKEWSFGEKLADRIASFGGSWIFLIIFAFFLACWIGINSLVLLRRAGRSIPLYPFKPGIILSRGHSGTDYHDESEQAGGQRQASVTA